MMMNQDSSSEDDFELRPGELTVCDWCKQEYVVKAEMLDGPDIEDEAWGVHNAIPSCPYCFERFKQLLGLNF